MVPFDIAHSGMGLARVAKACRSASHTPKCRHVHKTPSCKRRPKRLKNKHTTATYKRLAHKPVQGWAYTWNQRYLVSAAQGTLSIAITAGTALCARRLAYRHYNYSLCRRPSSIRMAVHISALNGATECLGPRSFRRTRVCNSRATIARLQQQVT